MGEESKSSEETKLTEEEALRSEIENLKKLNLELSSKNEELSERIETLQDSLDSVLEEMTLKDHLPSANPGNEENYEEENIEDENKKGAGKSEVEDLEKEIERSIKEEEAFRNEQESKIEELLLREEARDLESEINEALAKFPNASRDEILSEIELMTDEEAENADIMELAQLSHERRTIEQIELKNKIEGELKAQLQKEVEGGISVPQSSGAPSTPKTPASPSVSPTSSFTQDTEWAEALKRAKVEGGGV